MSEIETVEIAEPVVEKKQEEVKSPTREELRGKGWTKDELDAAEKRGMVAKVEEKIDRKKDEKPEPEKAKAEPVEEKKAEPVKETQKPSGIPDFTFKTPEQEKAWLEAFGPGTPQRGLYFRMKNERQARQAIEAERDALRRELELARTGKQSKVESGDLESLLSDEPESQGVDEDKPLTLRQLRELRESEERQQREAMKAEAVRKVKLAEAHKEQEEYARSIYPDFDDAVGKAKEVMQGLEKFVPERWRQAKVVRLMQDLQVAAAKADQLGLDDLNAAHIAYEIAQYHPEFGKSAEKDDPAETPKGAMTKDSIKRMEQNTQRRASSASVSAGGGSRTVSIDDIGVKELAAMSSAERWKFREKHPERYEKIVRG